MGSRGGGRRSIGIMVNTGRSRGGRRRGRRIGGIAIRKADDLGPGNNEPIEIVGIDVGPLVSVIHSGEAGEFTGGWLVGASILNVYLNAAWVVLGLTDRMESNDFIANQVLPGSQSSWNSRSPFVAICDQLIGSPLPVCISSLVDLEPFAIGSLEAGTVSVARSHKSGNGTLVIAKPVGPLEGHIAASIDVKRFVRANIAVLITSDVGLRDVCHGTIVWNLANDSSRNRAHVRIGERKPTRPSLTVGGDRSDITVSGHIGDRSKQCSESGKAAHR